MSSLVTAPPIRQSLRAEPMFLTRLPALATPFPHRAFRLKSSEPLLRPLPPGALRAIAKVRRETRYPTFSTVIPTLQKAVDDLPAKLRLRSARLLAAERVKYLQSLLAAIHAEAGQLLH